MRSIFCILALILSVTIAGSAQGGAGTASNGKTSKQQQSNIAANTAVEAQLQNSLDVRKAKVGDQVLLKTTKAIKQNGQIVIAKGSNLVGRVTEVAQKGKDNAMSRIGMVFDRLEGRDLTTPITASIVSITNVGASANAGGDDFNSDLMASSIGSARASSGGSSGGLLGGGSTKSSGGSSGGLLGGVTNTTGSLVNGATNTVGNVANTTTQAAGGVVRGTTQRLGSTTQSVGQTVNGLQISTSAGASAQGSTTVSSQNKNLRLEKGATFNLQMNARGGN